MFPFSTIIEEFKYIIFIFQVYINPSNVDDYLVESITRPANDPNAGEVYYRFLHIHVIIYCVSFLNLNQNQKFLFKVGIKIFLLTSVISSPQDANFVSLSLCYFDFHFWSDHLVMKANHKMKVETLLNCTPLISGFFYFCNSFSCICFGV